MADPYEYGSLSGEPTGSIRLDRSTEPTQPAAEATFAAPDKQPDPPPVPPEAIPERRQTQQPAATPKKSKSSREQFSGALQPLQVKLPDDLIQSLRLIAISQGKTLSDLTLEFLTSPQLVQKAWVSHRQAG